MKSKITVLALMLGRSILLCSFLFVLPAFANGGGHLWFYSQDPSTLPGPQPLPDPQLYDPNYVASSPDPWLADDMVARALLRQKEFRPEVIRLSRIILLEVN
jgi:hypothetical protein